MKRSATADVDLRSSSKVTTGFAVRTAYRGMKATDTSRADRTLRARRRGNVVDARRQPESRRSDGGSLTPVYGREKSAVFGISAAGVPMTIAISFWSVSSIARGSPANGSPLTEEGIFVRGVAN